jgi:hypothetical protein
MSVLITVEVRKIVLASLLLRAVRACCAEDYRPRLEEVFCSELALKPDH